MKRHWILIAALAVLFTLAVSPMQVAKADGGVTGYTYSCSSFKAWGNTDTTYFEAAVVLLTVSDQLSTSDWWENYLQLSNGEFYGSVEYSVPEGTLLTLTVTQRGPSVLVDQGGEQFWAPGPSLILLQLEVPCMNEPTTVFLDSPPPTEDPSTPVASETPPTPDTTEEPSTPVASETPPAPDTTDEPSTPVATETLIAPDTTQEPSTPVASETPVAPDVTEEPSTPVPAAVPSVPVRVPAPAAPVSYVLNLITCNTPIYDSPAGRYVGNGMVYAGQTFFTSSTPVIAADGSSWTQVFVGGWSNPYIPSECVQ